MIQNPKKGEKCSQICSVLLLGVLPLPWPRVAFSFSPRTSIIDSFSFHKSKYFIYFVICCLFAMESESDGWKALSMSMLKGRCHQQILECKDVW